MARADTSDGRLEIVGTGTGSFHVGVASLMPADNVSGFKAATIHWLKELGIEIARWPGGNFVSAYDWRDGIGDRDTRPPRRELAWHGLESNDMGIDDFMVFCRLVGAVPYLAVNSGLGELERRVAEVETGHLDAGDLSQTQIAPALATQFECRLRGVDQQNARGPALQRHGSRCKGPVDIDDDNRSGRPTGSLQQTEQSYFHAINETF